MHVGFNILCSWNHHLPSHNTFFNLFLFSALWAVIYVVIIVRERFMCSNQQQISLLKYTDEFLLYQCVYLQKWQKNYIRNKDVRTKKSSTRQEKPCLDRSVILSKLNTEMQKSDIWILDIHDVHIILVKILPPCPLHF